MLCNICWNILFIIWKLINVVKDRQMQPQISQRFFGESFLFNPDYFILLPRWLIFWLASNCCRVLGLRGQNVAQVQSAAFVGKPSAVGNHCRQLLKTTIKGKYWRQLLWTSIVGNYFRQINCSRQPLWATIVGNPNAAGNHCGQPSPQLFRS